jgi:hypothetical protein
MDSTTLKLLGLALHLLFLLTGPVACTHTLGAPEGINAYEPESVSQEMEQEEEEDVDEDADR